MQTSVFSKCWDTTWTIFKVASSVLLFFLEANWFMSSIDSTSLSSSDTTSLSKHFMTFEVKATGRRSLSAMAPIFLGIGVIWDHFHKAGTFCILRERWNRGHQAAASSSTQLFSRKAGSPSGPVALLKRRCTSRWSTSTQGVASVSGNDWNRLGHFSRWSCDSNLN